MATSPASSGFTLVELLIVIIVVGILSVIILVVYTGVTAEANTNTARAGAQAIVRKAAAYHTEIGHFPTSPSSLTSDATRSYYVNPSGIELGTAAFDTQPASPNTFRFLRCGTAPNETQSDITSDNITGLRIYFWRYTGSPGLAYEATGVDSGTAACPVE